MPYADKQKQKEYHRQYYQQNKETYRNLDRKRYKRDRDKRIASAKKRYQKKKLKEGYKGKFAKAQELGYRSMFEVSIAAAAEQAGMPLTYEPFYIPYVIKGAYRPDFVLPNGIIVEAKGYLDASACKKMLAVKHSNPHLDIRFVFQDANGRRNKRSKMRFWEWCEKHNFQYAERTIPLEWWKEKPIENPDN